jgi:hypothetical protein
MKMCRDGGWRLILNEKVLPSKRRPVGPWREKLARYWAARRAAKRARVAQDRALRKIVRQAKAISEGELLRRDDARPDVGSPGRPEI